MRFFIGRLWFFWELSISAGGFWGFLGWLKLLFIGGTYLSSKGKIFVFFFHSVDFNLRARECHVYRTTYICITFIHHLNTMGTDSTNVMLMAKRHSIYRGIHIGQM